VYDLRFAAGVERDLRKLSAYRRGIVLGAIESSLRDEPTKASRNRKILMTLTPPWPAEAPIRELRVGEYRVFYDVAEAEHVVYIRAIRRKPPGARTEDIL